MALKSCFNLHVHNERMLIIKEQNALKKEICRWCFILGFFPSIRAHSSAPFLCFYSKSDMSRLRLAAGGAIMKLAQEPCYHDIITPEQFQLCGLVINVSSTFTPFFFCFLFFYKAS